MKTSKFLLALGILVVAAALVFFLVFKTPAPVQTVPPETNATSTTPLPSSNIPQPAAPTKPITPKPAPVVLSAPKITNLLPMATTTGAIVTLTGTGFTPTGNNVNFGVFRAVSNLSSIDGHTISFTVPKYGGADCAPTAACPTWAVLFPAGSEMLTIKNANGVSNQLTFTLQ